MSEYPKLVVFDLDYTLWPFWVDTHVAVPLKALSKNLVVDKWGQKLKLYKDVESIIVELHQNGVTMAAASRTYAPEIAQSLLDMFHIGDKPLRFYFSSLQWGTGSKIQHIERAVKELNMEEVLQERNLILFDDERRNKDVERIGCKLGYLPNDEGLTREQFEKGLDLWRKWKKEDS